MARRTPADRLEVERAGGVATLTLAAAAAGPCLTLALHAELARVAAELDLDDELRVVVLRSRGRAFCTSAPPTEEGAGREVDPRRVRADGVAAIAALRVPVVALLQGDALDEGLELALACDLRVAAPGVRLGATQVTRGELPSHGATQRLPRLVGKGRALAMLLLGEPLRARAALDAGLVQRIVPAAELWRTGARLAAQMAERGPIAQRLAKEALHAALDVPLAEGLRLEGDLYTLLQSTADRDEGIASFRERRRPVFRNR